jgi:hypothetical protein
MAFSAWSQREISTNHIPAPVLRGQLYGISVDWSQTVPPPVQAGEVGAAEISLLSQTTIGVTASVYGTC